MDIERQQSHSTIISIFLFLRKKKPSKMEKEKHVKIVKFNTASQTMHWNIELAM